MIELSQTASILLYINIVLLGTFAMYLAYRYHSVRKVFIIVTICIFAIPAMFRYDVGTDYVQYIPVVNIIGNNSSLSRALMFTYKEPTLGVIFYFAASVFKNIRVGFPCMLWEHRHCLFFLVGNIGILQSLMYQYLCMDVCITTVLIIHLGKRWQLQ